MEFKDVLTLIIAILIPVMGGLTWLAYKHPNGYRIIAYGLFPALAIPAFFALMSICAAMSGAISNLKERLNDTAGQPLSDSENIIEILYTLRHIPNLILIISVVLFGYLFFLLKLPAILKDEAEKNRVKD